MKKLFIAMLMTTQLFSQEAVSDMYVLYTPGVEKSGYQDNPEDLGNKRLFKIDIKDIGAGDMLTCSFSSKAIVNNQALKSRTYSDSVDLMLYGSEYPNHLYVYQLSSYKAPEYFNRLESSDLSIQSLVNTSASSQYLVSGETSSSEQGSSKGSHSSLVVGSKDMMENYPLSQANRISKDRYNGSYTYQFDDHHQSNIMYEVKVECN